MPHNISLRDVRDADLEILFKHQLEPEAVQMAAFPSRNYQEFISHWKKEMRKETTFLQAIVYKNEVTGNVVCWEQDDKCNVGYWLGREYWGLGIASAALKLFLMRVNQRPLYAHVASHNVASIRVLVKNGFAQLPSDRFSSSDGDKVEEYVMMLE